MSVEVKDLVSVALKYHQSGNLIDAENSYAEILKVHPDNVDVLNLLGLLKLQTKQFDESLYYINKAVNLKPCDYFWGNLGRAYFAKKNFVESINCYKKALELNPNNFDALFNMALTYKKNKDFDKAIEAYQASLTIKLNHPDVYFNIANCYENQNDTATALEYYEKALEHNINDSNIDYFLAVSYLKTKDFEKGWQYYEHRPSKEFGILTQTLQYKDLMNSKPLWTGESLEGKTLFVYYEAGLGDTLMYARYIPFLKSKGAKIVLKPQSCLVKLLEDSDLGAEIIDLPIENLDFDFHIPLMSIPYVLQQNSENDIMLADGYLKSSPAKVQEYKEKHFNNTKFKIGIKWQGNPAYDRNRIIPLEQFYKLFDLANTKFYSLQKDDGAEELEKLPDDYELIDLGSTFNDFADTAAAIENLDLVICNDTSVAHLVGAMGKPCWIMLPYVLNWRWHNDISYSPWYKSVKLFKQNELDNWDNVFEEAQIFLKEILNQRI